MRPTLADLRATRGKWTTKRTPRPTSLSSEIVPSSWRVTIWLTMYRPRPLPPAPRPSGEEGLEHAPLQCRVDAAALVNKFEPHGVVVLVELRTHGDAAARALAAEGVLHGVDGQIRHHLRQRDRVAFQLDARCNLDLHLSAGLPQARPEVAQRVIDQCAQVEAAPRLADAVDRELLEVQHQLRHARGVGEQQPRRLGGIAQVGLARRCVEDAAAPAPPRCGRSGTTPC